MSGEAPQFQPTSNLITEVPKTAIDPAAQIEQANHTVTRETFAALGAGAIGDVEGLNQIYPAQGRTEQLALPAAPVEIPEPYIPTDAERTYTRAEMRLILAKGAPTERPQL